MHAASNPAAVSFKVCQERKLFIADVRVREAPLSKLPFHTEPMKYVLACDKLQGPTVGTLTVTERSVVHKVVSY